MRFLRITSRGWPFFSYMAIKNAGSMTSIITIAAELFPRGFLSKKKSGTPMSAPHPKHSNCRLVRFRSILLLTLFKSEGMET